MNYKVEFLKDLKIINEKINLGEFNGIDNALGLFSIYLNNIKVLGRFNPLEWKQNWRNEVYLFGENFEELDPVNFLKIIDKVKVGLNKDETEVLDFFKSEITINNQLFDDCINDLNSIIAKYPYNPEFRHSLGHFYNAKGE
jgi:hypothetical protein